MGTAGGWTLPDLLRAESLSGRKSPKSVIMIYLVGGPPHQDMFDLKPEAPKEIAGPWRPIATNVPGIEICEAFPRLAKHGRQADRDSFAGRQSGRPRRDPGLQRPRPEEAEAVRRLAAVRLDGLQSCRGRHVPTSPPYVSLCYTCTHGPYNEPGPGFLGTAHSPFRPLGPTQRRHGPERRDARSAGRPEDAAAKCSTSFAATSMPRRR